MYDELIARLRETSMDFGELDHVSVLLLQAADVIEELANKLCDWCGVCPKERRRPWDCEITWPDAPAPEVYIEPPKEE